MKDFALIVTDTSPLITLAKADELDLLLRLGVPVEVPDVVFFEATLEGHEDGQRLRRWINENKEQARVVPTDRSAEWQALKDQGFKPKGYGELAAAEAIDTFVRLNPGRSPIILYEDTDVEKLRGLPSETELITTGTYLRDLETARLIQSADQILDQAMAAGRNVEKQRDQPSNPDLVEAFRRWGEQGPARDRGAGAITKQSTPGDASGTILAATQEPPSAAAASGRRRGVIGVAICAGIVGLIALAVAFHLLLPPDPIFAAWVDVVGKLGPLVIAALVGLVGWRQYRSTLQQTDRAHALQRQQLRLALFDRRYALYRRYRDVQGEMVQTGDCSREGAIEATQVSLEAQFLFDPATTAFLDRFQKLAWDLRCWQSLYEAALRNQPEQAQAEIERHTRLIEQLSATYDEGDQLFRAAMGVVDAID